MLHLFKIRFNKLVFEPDDETAYLIDMNASYWLIGITQLMRYLQKILLMNVCTEYSITGPLFQLSMMKDKIVSRFMIFLCFLRKNPMMIS